MPDTGIGASVRRKEDQRFLTGKGRYTDDLNRPGQVHAVFVRSPHAHATVASVKTDAAAAAAGVIAVYTGKDMEADSVGSLPCGWTVTDKHGEGHKAPPHFPLVRDKVRYVGDHIAVVIAETATQARDAAELYDAAAEQRGQSLTTKIADGCLVRGDRNLLSQAISNLLDNALTHTPDDGAIVIAVAQGADGPELTVADNGPGIPEADRDRVLHRFTRLDASRSTPGSGLGLSQVAATARLHEAALRLTDNQPGLRVSLAFQRAADT